MRSFAIKSNDMMLVVYLSSMIRAVLALHNLIDNKEQRMWHEQQQKEGDGKALENGKLVSLASALRKAVSTVFGGQRTEQVPLDLFSSFMSEKAWHYR